MGVYFCGSGCCECVRSDLRVCGSETEKAGVVRLSRQKPLTGLLNTQNIRTEEREQKKTG